MEFSCGNSSQQRKLNSFNIIVEISTVVAEAAAGYMAEQFSEVEFTSDVGDAVSAALNIDTSLAAFCAALTVSWRIYFLGKLLFWHHVKE